MVGRGGRSDKERINIKNKVFETGIIDSSASVEFRPQERTHMVSCSC